MNELARADGGAGAAARAAAGLDLGTAEAEELLGPVRDWLGSPLRAEIAAATRVRAEVPILLRAGGTVLRGSIDLLVEREGLPPLVVDYKTDRLRGEDPAARAAHYEIQRSIYALAAAESLGADEVEVAYVFLERADTPARTVLTRADMDAGRARIDAAVTRISAGDFIPPPNRSAPGTSAVAVPPSGRLCSGRRSRTPALRDTPWCAESTSAVELRPCQGSEVERVTSRCWRTNPTSPPDRPGSVL